MLTPLDNRTRGAATPDEAEEQDLTGGRVMTRTSSDGRGRSGSSSSLYLAHIRTGSAEVFRDDNTRVDRFAIPHGSNLRRVLVEHGWRPAGHGVRDGAWDSITVEPLPRF